MANEVALTFSELVTNELTRVESALPKDFNKTRFVQNAITVLNDNPALTKINKAQLLQGLMRGAYLGLDFLNKECYLIPYGNTINFQTDYKGEIKFTKRYSTRPIDDIYAKVVRDGDEFQAEIKDGKPTIYFKPKPFNDGEIVGVFAVVLYADGCMDYETMSKKDVDDVRKNYVKGNNPSWTKSYGEMAKKVCLRRLCKHIDKDYESLEAHRIWDESSGMDFSVRKKPNEDEIVDVFDDKDITDVFDDKEIKDEE